MKENEEKERFALDKVNYRLIIIGCLIVLVGFLLMMGGGSEDPNVFNEEEIFSERRITIAPLTVIIGYIFIIYAIMKRPKDH